MPTATRKSPGIIDTFIILFTSVALTLFILWAASRLRSHLVFETLSDWLQKSIAKIWASAFVGTAGLASAVYRWISKKPDDTRPNYLLYIGVTTVTLIASILILPRFMFPNLVKKDSEDLVYDVQKVLESLPTLPTEVLPSLHDDIVAKLDLTKTSVPVKRVVTVFYEPNSSERKGFVKLQLIQFGDAEAGTLTQIKGRLVSSTQQPVTARAFLYHHSKPIEDLSDVKKGNKLFYSFQVSSEDIVAVAAIYPDRLVNGNDGPRSRMDWTSVAVQELAVFKPVIYDFAIASQKSQVTIVDSTEFWRDNETGHPMMRKRNPASANLAALPGDVLQAFRTIAAQAAEVFPEDPYTNAFKALSNSDLTGEEWATDHSDGETNNVVYATHQIREKP